VKKPKNHQKNEKIPKKLKNPKIAKSKKTQKNKKIPKYRNNR